MRNIAPDHCPACLARNIVATVCPNGDIVSRASYLPMWLRVEILAALTR